MALNYEIRVRGRVDPDFVDVLGLVVHPEPVETILHGGVEDQASLHELLGDLQELGLELVELRRLPPPLVAPPASRPPSWPVRARR